MIVYFHGELEGGEYLLEIDGAYENMDCEYALYTFCTNYVTYERYADITAPTDFIM